MIYPVIVFNAHTYKRNQPRSMMKPSGKNINAHVTHFECFDVHAIGDRHILIHIDIENKNFYKSLFEYFFSENMMLEYSRNQSDVTFEGSKIDYIDLWQSLKNYIDSESLTADRDELELALDQYALNGEIPNNTIKLRLDKIGKIGEYMSCCVLSKYFNFDCIVPKLKMITNRNMSIFGIDSLFYSSKNSSIMFGESKVSVRLDKGVGLIKKSLENYEMQIREEYLLIIRNRTINKNAAFRDKFEKYAEKSIDICKFIEAAEIKRIGVPIFIVHGTETDPLKILHKLESISKKKFFDLETEYYFISLPIIDKYKMVAEFMKNISAKADECYEHGK